MKWFKHADGSELTRIVFLDFDGVLNGDRHLAACDEDPALSLAAGPMGIDARAVRLLNGILTRASAQVVVSSSWRRQHSLVQLQEALDGQGLRGTVLDVTPLSSGLGRGGEIRAWLEQHEVHGFVVLDDLPPSNGLHERWVQTDPRSGLTKRDCERAIELCMRAMTPP